MEKKSLFYFVGGGESDRARYTERDTTVPKSKKTADGCLLGMIALFSRWCDVLGCDVLIRHGLSRHVMSLSVHYQQPRVCLVANEAEL